MDIEICGVLCQPVRPSRWETVSFSASSVGRSGVTFMSFYGWRCGALAAAIRMSSNNHTLVGTVSLRIYCYSSGFKAVSHKTDAHDYEHAVQHVPKAYADKISSTN